MQIDTELFQDPYGIDEKDWLWYYHVAKYTV